MNEFKKPLSSQMDSLFRSIGWYPNRVVEQSLLDRWYAFEWSDGGGYCAIFPAALRIVKEFGGLNFDERFLGSGGRALRIEPLDILTSYYTSDIWLRHEWGLEEQLYPLGVLKDYDEDSPISVSSSGRIAIDTLAGGLLHLGDSFEEAMETLIDIKYLENYDMCPYTQDETRTIEAINQIYTSRR